MSTKLKTAVKDNFEKMEQEFLYVPQGCCRKAFAGVTQHVMAYLLTTLVFRKLL